MANDCSYPLGLLQLSAHSKSVLLYIYCSSDSSHTPVCLKQRNQPQQYWPRKPLLFVAITVITSVVRRVFRIAAHRYFLSSAFAFLMFISCLYMFILPILYQWFYCEQLNVCFLIICHRRPSVFSPAIQNRHNQTSVKLTYCMYRKRQSSCNYICLGRWLMRLSIRIFIIHLIKHNNHADWWEEMQVACDCIVSCPSKYFFSHGRFLHELGPFRSVGQHLWMVRPGMRGKS